MKQITIKQILYLLLLFLIAFIPLYPKFPLIAVSGTFVAIRVEDFIIAAVFLIFFIFEIKNYKKYLSNIIFQAFLLFWVIGLVGIFSTNFLTHSVMLKLAFLHWLRRIEYMFPFFIAASSIQKIKNIKIILALFLIVDALVLFYGFGQLYLGFKVVSTVSSDVSGVVTTLSPTGRVNSTFAGHYDLAIFLSFVLIFIVSFFFYVKKIWQKGVLAILGVVNLVLLGYTAARASFVAMVFGALLSLWILKQRLLMLLLLILSLAIVLAVPSFRSRVIATINVDVLHNVGPTYNPPPAPKPVSQKSNLNLEQTQIASLDAAKIKKLKLPRDIAKGEPTNYTELEVARSSDIRFDIEWPRAYQAILINPFLGTGYSSLSLATDNDYLRSLGETGILGTISLILIFYLLIRVFCKNLKSENIFVKIYLTAILALIVDVLITAFFIDVLEASKVAFLFWIIMGVTYALCQSFNKE